MAHYTVTLNWDGGTFLPEPKVLEVKKDDTISFQLGTVPSGSKFQISANDRGVFSPEEIQDSGTKVKVVEALKSSFRCQLFDSAGNLLSREDQDGLHVQPD
jgi:NAD(P)H-nitrite reductase large subunit